MKQFFYSLNLVLIALCLTHCSEPENKKPLEHVKAKAAELYAKMASLEGELKSAGSDEGKQNFIRHDIELLKSRLLRLKEEAKHLNGGVELPLEPAPAGGGH